MRQLVVSIHDVGPRFEAEVSALHTLLARHVPAERIAMLVVPNHWGEHPILPGNGFAKRLRAWADSGVEIFLHGWFHRDTSDHPGRFARLKAKHMTAGEGEFLGLGLRLALERMRDGRALIEGITGKPVAGFVAPAWLYGPAALTALTVCGFLLAEDHMKVWQPATGTIVARGPVITWASRSRARIASSLLAARLLPPALHFTPVVRVAVHPGDVHVPALMQSIDRTLRTLVRTRQVVRYHDLAS